MMFTYPELDTVVDTENGRYNSIVIENQQLMCRLLRDITDQLKGFEGAAVVSKANQPQSFSSAVELLDVFIPFEINRKTLITKIIAAMEKTAVSADFYERTLKLLYSAEELFEDIAFEYPCDIVFSKLSAGALLKALSPQLRTDADNIAEQLLDYMELVSEFDREKLFITLNMRSFVSDSDMEMFAEAALLHGYHLLAIENREHSRLQCENRLIIDSDLCEID